MATTISEQIDPRLIGAYNDFGFRLLTHLTEQDARKNIFISPFSIAVALAMTYNGADGTTKAAMAKTLGLERLNLEEVNAANASLAALQNLDPQVQLAVANA